MRIVSSLLCVCASITGCSPLVNAFHAGNIDAPAHAMAAGFSRLVFQDDFDSLSLNEGDIGGRVWYNGIWSMKKTSIELFSVSQGVLRLSTPAVNRWGATTAISTISREGTASGRVFVHGYFEARLRFRNTPENWSAFWLYSARRTMSKQPNSMQAGEWCEIDVLESMYPRYYAGTVHKWSPAGDVKNSNAHVRVPEGFELDDRWNVFGLLWQNGRVSWYLNNVKVSEAPLPEVCERDPMFLVIGSQKKRGGDSLDLYVDWVRVWQ